MNVGTVNATHTPGPWRQYGRAVYTESTVRHWIENRDARQRMIATIWANGNEMPDIVDDVSDNPPNEPEAHANAHLIAAAPELLAALRDCEHYLSLALENPGDFMGVNEEVHDAIATAQAAIRKARGQA